MPRSTFRLCFNAWIATFAVLTGALAPGVSQAMAMVGDGKLHWVEVCSSIGVSWIAVDADGELQGDGDSAVAGAHCCPYCSLYAGLFALPPSASPAFAEAQPRQLRPSSQSLAFRPLVAWSASRSRAPPHAS